jgi:hypothetical protein
VFVQLRNLILIFHQGASIDDRIREHQGVKFTDLVTTVIAHGLLVVLDTRLEVVHQPAC